MFRRVWAAVDLHTPLADVPARASRVERLGFDGLAVPDAVHDGPLAAAAAVSATRTIAVRTSGLVAFARSPMTTAIAAWDLQALSGGRFQLGLGPLVRPIVVDRYSVPWSAPAPRMREYILALRAIFDCWQHGTPLHFVGEHYRLTRMQDFMKPPPLDRDDDARMRIVVAGIGPRMTQLAGELADAINTHPTNTDPVFLRHMTLPNLARGAARRGRDPSEIAVIVNALCATGFTDDEVHIEREKARSLLATLYSTREYVLSLELHGWQDRGEELRRRVREQRWSDLARLVTDEMLDVLVPTARYPELPNVLLERYGGIADEITLPLPDDDRHDGTVAQAVAALKA